MGFEGFEFARAMVWADFDLNRAALHLSLKSNTLRKRVQIMRDEIAGVLGKEYLTMRKRPSVLYGVQDVHGEPLVETFLEKEEA